MPKSKLYILQRVDILNFILKPAFNSFKPNNQIRGEKAQAHAVYQNLGNPLRMPFTTFKRVFT